MFAAALAMIAAPAGAKTIVIQMKNMGSEGAMVFEPGFVRAQKGDVVRFVPTDLGHNAEAIPTIWPAGVPVANGMINKELTVPLTTPGLYGFKCLPHFGMGMVALVQVGPAAPASLANAKAAQLPPLAAKRMNNDLAHVN